MDPGDAGARSELQAVEIGAAVLVGGLIAIVPTIAMWLMGRTAGLTGPGWASATDMVQVVSIVVGIAVVVWRLVRARRCGL